MRRIGVCGLVVLSGCSEPATAKRQPVSADSSPTNVTDSPPTESRSVDSGGGDSEVEDSEPDSIPEVTGPPGVVLFIGDGMGLRHVAGGGLYKNGVEGSLILETLPYQGRLRTGSYTGITDSAAAATAMATGAKTFNGRLGLDRDGLSVESVREVAAARGMATGVVTTDTLVGATPSAFTVHNEDRGEDEAIAADLLLAAPDLAFGGGGAVLLPLLSEANLQVLTTGDQLSTLVSDGRPVFGVFAEALFPYVADGYGTEPTLAAMALAAVDYLDDDPDGFFVMIEGARIDHASHINRSDAVHLETAAFDDAIAAVLDHLVDRPNTTVVVTADHECGGIKVEGGTPAGTSPTTSWRWTQHTNADVGVYAMGDAAAVLDGVRVDNAWVHAVLVSGVTGDPLVEPPSVWIPDGYTEDLGEPVVTQSWSTSFGGGYNQLDQLRLTSDDYGLWIGVDGVFEREQNAVLLFVDVDYGVGPAAEVWSDRLGTMDAAISTLPLDFGDPAFGADFVVGSLGAYEAAASGGIGEGAGLRGLHSPWGAEDNFAWYNVALTFDDGNVAEDAAAVDAGSTGTTLGGMETVIPWSRIFPAGIPVGSRIAVVALLSNESGTYTSNQRLPAAPTELEPGTSTVALESAAVLEVDVTGFPLGPAVLSP